MQTFLQDLRFGLRVLLRKPGLTFIARLALVDARLHGHHSRH
jgi:hypothetical protein